MGEKPRRDSTGVHQDATARYAMAEESAERCRPGLLLFYSPLEPGNFQTFPFDESGALTIGRSPGCDVAIETVRDLSKTHARVEWKGEGVILSDLGSSNGTSTAGTRLVKDDEMPASVVVSSKRRCM